LFMPTYVSLLLTYNKVKFASIWLPLLIVPYSVLAYFVGGIKLALMTLATLTVVTILCIFKRIFSRKEDGIKSLLVVVTSMFFSTFLIVSSNKDVTMKFMAYLNPAKFENTAPILNIMENIDLVGYNITSTSLNNLGNIYSCTYAHVLDVFGLIVLVALLLIGMACGVLLIVRSLAKEEKYESLVGLLFGCLFVLQIIMGFASSFLMIPQANFGAALITNKSFEYGFVGIVYYISVIMPEKRCEFGVAEYLKNGYLVLKDVIFPKDEE